VETRRYLDLEDPLIPSTVACMLLGIGRTTLMMWIKKGKIKAVRVGRLWKIPVSEIKRLKQPWIEV
jgi:DNA binding domain, excisionase family